MATADQIYQFRRTEAGMTFENITKFREAFKEHHHRPVTAKQVLEALADKPDGTPPLSVAKGPSAHPGVDSISPQLFQFGAGQKPLHAFLGL